MYELYADDLLLYGLWLAYIVKHYTTFTYS